jgi:hypothetical protein
MSFNLFGLRKKQLSNTVVAGRSATGAASSTALSVTQNGTVVQTINCGRNNYQGEILPAVTGLPTGVTAVISPALLKRNVSDVTITYTATDVAPTVTNDAFTVTLTSGFGVQTINCTMTVTASSETGTPPVLLSAVTPSSGLVSTPTAITLTGTGFTSGATVTVNGVSATSVVFVNSTSITCTTPSLAAGVYDVTVTQTSGISTRPAAFTSGAVLIAAFKASVDFGTPSTTAGSNFDTRKNGVRLYNKGTGQVWPVAHSTAPGITYEGGSYVFRINMSSNAANEIRFDGIPAVPELFTEWHMYQPSGAETPDVGEIPISGSTSGIGNDKFFRLWSVSYTTGIKVGASYWHDAINSIGYLGTEHDRFNGTSLVGMGEGGSAYTPTNRQPVGGFMGASAYYGRWVRVRIHNKVATVANNDGINKIWLDDTLILNRTNLPIYTDGVQPNSFTNGYILGSKNSGNNGTKVYIDNVRFSTGGFA